MIHIESGLHDAKKGVRALKAMGRDARIAALKDAGLWPKPSKNAAAKVSRKKMTRQVLTKASKKSGSMRIKSPAKRSTRA